jgi:thiol:disulfide interchange protein DsbA
MSPFARRRGLLAALCASPSLLLARPAFAQGPTVPQEGTDYTVEANPQPTNTPGKIEVLDFFWYGCPHCYAFLPSLEAWRKRQPSDVLLKHVPVAFDNSREPHSRIFYALEVLGRIDGPDSLHVRVFDAFHRDRIRLNDRDEIADFMEKQGIERAKWLAAYDSFSVAGDVNRARMITQAYQIDGTPTLAIDGRYLTSPSIASSHTNDGTLYVVDYLIEKVRRERPRNKKG